MNLDGAVLRGSFPVCLLNHLIIKVLIVFEQLVKTFIILTTRQLLLLLFVASLFFVRLHKCLLDDLYLGSAQLNRQLQAGSLELQVLGVALHQVAVVDIVEGERLHDGQATVVLVYAEAFLELLLPSICIRRSRLKRVLELLGA